MPKSLMIIFQTLIFLMSGLFAIIRTVNNATYFLIYLLNVDLSSASCRPPAQRVIFHTLGSFLTACLKQKYV